MLCLWCGCTDEHACPGGCSWVLRDHRGNLGICSSCDGVKVVRGGSERFVESVFVDLGVLSIEIPEAHAGRLLVGLKHALPEAWAKLTRSAAKRKAKRK